MNTSVIRTDPKPRSFLGKLTSSQVNAPTPTRSDLLQMVTPEPKVDQGKTDRQKKLAKTNAIGQALSAFAQLGGVAAGGDAVRINDYTGPEVLRNLSDLDFDYQRQLQDYYRQLFATNQYNTSVINDQKRYDDQQDFAREQQEQQYARDDKRLDMSKDFAREQRLTAAGIDPKDPDADAKYLAHQKSMNSLERQNAQSIINSRQTSGEPSISPDTMAAIMKGRDKKLQSLKTDLSRLTKDNLGGKNDAQIKAINSQIQMLNEIKADPKSLMINELFTLGSQSETVPGNPLQNFSFAGGVIRPTPQQTESLTSMSPQKLLKRVRENPNDTEALTVLAQAMVNKGYASNLEEAKSKILASN